MSPSLRTLLPQRDSEGKTARQVAPVAPAKSTRPLAKVPAKPAAPVKKENRLVRWYRETESELRKVVWPTREEWTNLTLIVVATTVVVGFSLGIIDFVFERLILLIR